MKVRHAEAHEVPELAKLWHDGWHEAHACLMPAEVVAARTLESFATRLSAGLGDARTAGAVGAPLGLCLLKGDELNQLYVAQEARGLGVAAALLADAQARLLASGVATAWLACAIGNLRAARFYEKSGWHRVGTVILPVRTVRGPVDVEAWRYEKRLTLSP